MHKENKKQKSTNICEIEMEWPCKNRLLPLLFTLMVLLQISGSKGCFQEEKTALLDFKAFAKFSNVTEKPFLSSWVNDSNSDCCHWERVTCDPHTNHMIHLSLGHMYQEGYYCQRHMSLNFSYFLPLKQLKNLNLSHGCFKDGIMSEGTSALTTLETLDLSFNLFDISILKSLTAFKSLKNLIVAGSGLLGQIPIQELSVFKSLELLDLSTNDLHNPSKSQDNSTWSKFKKLRTLNLAHNAFSMEILKPLVALPALRSLFLNDNYFFEGLDDKILANLSNLEILILRDSVDITTRLPIKGLCKMKNLQELDLSHNNFIGTVQSCLSNLTSLRALDLSNNFLSGSVSSSVIAKLTSLEYLRISNNNFEGIFSLSSLRNHSKLQALILGEMNSSKFQVKTENPPWIPSFQLKYLKMPNCKVNLHKRTIPSFLLFQHNLRYIDISHNNLIGRFPNWLLENNPKLHGAFLNDNSFTGTFQLPFNPNQHMDQLQILNISNNKIQGELPDNIGFIFPHLNYLELSNNEFDGHIPASIGEMSNLTILDLANNNFSGKVPKKMFLQCKLLQILILSNNRLEGEIFFKQMKMGLLESLVLENNNFNGTLQDGLSSMVNLYALVISNNQFSGELSTGWPKKLSYLQILNASTNNFHGVISNDLCKMMALDLIDFSHNKLSGPLPTCLSSLHMRFIHLQGNNLTGTLPKALISNPNPNLMFLNVRDNRISGSIPKSIGLFVNLKIFLLGGNQLQGHLHNQIYQLQNLVFLDLSRNNFTGSIPSCFNNMSFGKENKDNDDDFEISHFPWVYDILLHYQYLHFEEEIFRMSSDRDFTFIEEQYTTKSVFLTYKGKTLNNMAGMDLSCNQLSGEIPKQIGDLHALHSLNLSHNQLSGSIPENFHNLRNIESLNLSYNHLSGTIPLQLQELNSLSFFNVSYNDLSGQAPNQGQFGSFDESSYRGNPHLLVNNSNRGIVTPQPPPLPPFSDDDEEDSPIDFIAFCWCFDASYITILFVFVTILWINPYWRWRWFYFIETCLYNCFGHLLEGAFY